MPPAGRETEGCGLCHGENTQWQLHTHRGRYKRKSPHVCVQYLKYANSTLMAEQDRVTTVIYDSIANTVTSVEFARQGCDRFSGLDFSRTGGSPIPNKYRYKCFRKGLVESLRKIQCSTFLAPLLLSRKSSVTLIKDRNPCAHSALLTVVLPDRQLNKL